MNSAQIAAAYMREAHDTIGDALAAPLRQAAIAAAVTRARILLDGAEHALRLARILEERTSP